MIPKLSPFSYYSLLPNFPSTRLLRFGTSLVQLCRKSSNQSGKVGDYGAAVTRLRFPVSPRPIRMRRAEGVGGGVTGRMMLLRRYVSKLLDDERIELPWPHATETRLYAERLIQESILASAEQDLVSLFELWKNSKEPKTNDKLNLGILELSVFWLTEERLVEKLFKVFVPRYRFYERAYTSLFQIFPPVHPIKSSGTKSFGILELHGNPWPPVRGHGIIGRSLNPEPFQDRYLINVLLDAARESSAKKNCTPSTSSPIVIDYELRPIN
ncbi:large subunit ribosomal protein L17 [Schistosoma bovis]|uniref:Large ribosomal subunit protein bL17m n=1 Tax=Schistosoma bovis TaxID=6184 RepID=A0A430QRM8_SCHBO|nr:large subunit ribosomal protein L17 [Schistosoma bovis]